MASQQLAQTGPQLTLTMGGMGEFVNVLVLTGIIVFLCGLAIWIALIIIK